VKELNINMLEEIDFNIRDIKAINEICLKRLQKMAFGEGVISLFTASHELLFSGQLKNTAPFIPDGAGRIN
jgi:hypothetical protein